MVDNLKVTGNLAEREPILNTNKRTFEQKIGKTTYIVSTRFNDKGKGDIVSKIARLIQNDTTNNT